MQATATILSGNIRKNAKKLPNNFTTWIRSIISTEKMAETKSMQQNDTSKIQGGKDTLLASKTLSYLNKPPSIPPNYGRQNYTVCHILKSKISRVLLYDNITQERMLDRKLNLLGGEQRRVMQLLDYHRKSFEHQRNLKQKRLARIPVTHFEETRKVQPKGMPEGGRRQKLPKILSGATSAQAVVSNSSCVLKPLVSPTNPVRYPPLWPDKRSQTQHEQMSKLSDSLTLYVNNNNNIVDKPCESQGKGIKKNCSNQEYDIRFVSLERLLTPMNKN